MSAAKDEADDGPDLSSDEGAHEEKRLEDAQSDLSPEDELPTPKLAKPNGFRDEDELTLDDGDSEVQGRKNRLLESGGLDLVRASHSGLGRPSSADGSLSTPDDGPSAQVSIGP